MKPRTRTRPGPGRSNAWRAAWALWLACFLANVASAQEDDWSAAFDDEEEAQGTEDGVFALGGNVKTFMVGSRSFPHLLYPNEPVILGSAVGRLKLDIDPASFLHAEVHPVVNLQSGGSAALALGGFSTGAVGSRPEAVTLSWRGASSPSGSLLATVDRLLITLKLPHVNLTLGRQPVTFGQTFFFNPTDLVAPFTPTTIDTEFKPGVDALRADLYFLTSGQLTLVAAYAGSRGLSGTVLASHLRYSLLGVELGAFAAEDHRDHVVGADFAAGLFGVGIRGEATLTAPAASTWRDRLQDAFVRASLSADAQLPGNISLVAELYVQTLGALKPSDALQTAALPQFARSEIWLLGTTYAALSMGWELTPLLRPSLFAIINLTDQSYLMSPSLSWSVSDEVELVLGAQLAQGEHPAPVTPADLVGADGQPKSPAEVSALLSPKTEFGLYPSVFYGQIRVYF